MAEEPEHKVHNPAPLYILLILAICLCGFFFWIGTVCVRLWFYKGALGPEPERFLILPLYWKKKQLQPQLQHTGQNSKRFLHAADTPSNPSSENFAIPEPKIYFTTIPKISIQGTEKDYDDTFVHDFEDPAQVRRYIDEERRISRLPPFDQDDCGDGSEFPNVPYANKPVEAQCSHSLSETKSYLQLGLHKVNNMGKWLTIDNSYIKHHEARISLLETKQAECVQVKRDGEVACEELMNQVVQHLCIKYPDHFTMKTKGRRKYVRNKLAREEHSIVRPFEYHPLEICARLAAEDFNIFVKNGFSLQWYLQASATLFPSGWNMRQYIGKSLHTILGEISDPSPLWDNLSDILDTIATSTKLFTRTSTFIQTLSAEALSASLFIQRPADFFPGDVCDLFPTNLYVRREYQTFRLLPKSGAVVMSIRTELTRLTDWDDCKGLMREIQAWEDDEAIFKGRDLWIKAVRWWYVGWEGRHDDQTVVDVGKSLQPARIDGC